MTPSKKLVFLLLSLFSVIIVITKVQNALIFPYLMLALMAAIISITIRNYKKQPSKSVFLKIIIYICVTFADIFLNFTPYAKMHILLFLIVQVLLIIAYLYDVPFKKKDLLYLTVPVVISTILYFIIVVPFLPHPLGAAFTIYIICLTLMVWRGFCFIKANILPQKQKWLLFIGSLCFYCTDVLVGVRIIYNPELINLWVYILYPPALFLIATSDWYRKKAL